MLYDIEIHYYNIHGRLMRIFKIASIGVHPLNLSLISSENFIS